MEVEESVSVLLTSAFRHYKSLDEATESGIFDGQPRLHHMDRPAPALQPAVALFSLLNDTLHPETQQELCSLLQVCPTLP